MKKDVQSKVKSALLKGQKLTENICLFKFQGRRLAGIVHRLRKPPHNMDIVTKLIPEKGGSQYAEYSLKKR